MFDLRSPPKPRLLCLGLSAFDITWTVEALPGGGGKTRALDLHEGGGGMAANAAVAAAALGAEVQFWGRAGHDRAGLAMREALAERGVDVAQFRLFDGARSSVSGIVVDPCGERAIVNFRGEGLPADPAWLPLPAVAEADAVLADPRWPEGALALFQAARRHGVPTVLDGDVADAEVFDRLLPFVDAAVFSEPGLSGYVEAADATGDRSHAAAFSARDDRQRMAGYGDAAPGSGPAGAPMQWPIAAGARKPKDPLTSAPDPHEGASPAAESADLDPAIESRLRLARSRGCRLAAVTLGERGVAWSDASGSASLPACPVDVVDTTGAGDVFHGAFTFALGARTALRDAFAFASVVAALKCRHRGGRAGVPDLAAALASLQSFKESA